jgi:hypothetical protein
VQSPKVEAPHARASRRRRVVWALIFSSPIWLAAWVYFYVEFSANGLLTRAIGDADRLDPGWRLGDLLNKRNRIEDDVNSADLVLQVVSIRPDDTEAGLESGVTPVADTQEPTKGRLQGADLDSRLNEARPPERLAADIAYALKTELGIRAKALALARKLRDTGEGQYKINYDPLIFNTLLPHAQPARNLARLLQKDAYIRADRGDIDGALDSAGAIVGVARSFGDEPFAISQMVRIACGSFAMISFDRALSQGEASDRSLARIQASLALEARQPLLLYGLRGERAATFDTLDKLATGEVPVKALGPGLPGSGALAIPLQVTAFGRHNQGLALDIMNRAVEIAKRPSPEQSPLWDKWAAEFRESSGIARYFGMLAHMLAPAGESMGQACQRSRAILSVGQVMAACERYRLGNTTWPETLDQLVPIYLSEIPQDPFDGKPLRMLRTKEGLTIYSVGKDLKDDGGKFHRSNAALPGYDVGFRLWNLELRRAPSSEDDATDAAGRAQPVPKPES